VEKNKHRDRAIPSFLIKNKWMDDYGTQKKGFSFDKRELLRYPFRAEGRGLNLFFFEIGNVNQQNGG